MAKAAAEKKPSKAQMELFNKGKAAGRAQARAKTVAPPKAPKKPARRSPAGLHGAALAAYLRKHGKQPWNHNAMTVWRPGLPRAKPAKPRATVRAGESRGGVPGTTNPAMDWEGAAKGTAIVVPVGFVSFLAPAALAAAVGGSPTRQLWVRRIAGGGLVALGFVAKAMGHDNIGSGLAAGGIVSAAGNEIMGRLVDWVFDMRAKVFPPTPAMTAVATGQQARAQLPPAMRAVSVQRPQRMNAILMAPGPGRSNTRAA